MLGTASLNQACTNSQNARGKLIVDFKNVLSGNTLVLGNSRDFRPLGSRKITACWAAVNILIASLCLSFEKHLRISLNSQTNRDFLHYTVRYHVTPDIMPCPIGRAVI